VGTVNGDPRGKGRWEASWGIGEAEEAREDAEEAAILPWVPSTANQGRLRAPSADEKAATADPAAAVATRGGLPAQGALSRPPP